MKNKNIISGLKEASFDRKTSIPFFWVTGMDVAL